MRAALFSHGDMLFVVVAVVAVACLLIAIVEWYENRSVGVVLAFVGGALFAILVLWLSW